LVVLFPGLRAGFHEPLGDHVHRAVEVEVLPLRAVRRPVFELVLADRAVDVSLRCRTLRAQPAARDRGVGIALDLDDLLVLDVDPLAAADSAVGTDRLHDAVCRLGARGELPRALRPRRASEPERVAAELIQERGDQARPAHNAESTLAPRLK